MSDNHRANGSFLPESPQTVLKAGIPIDLIKMIGNLSPGRKRKNGNRGP